MSLQILPEQREDDEEDKGDMEREIDISVKQQLSAMNSERNLNDDPNAGRRDDNQMGRNMPATLLFGTG